MQTPDFKIAVIAFVITIVSDLQYINYVYIYIIPYYFILNTLQDSSFIIQKISKMF